MVIGAARSSRLVLVPLWAAHVGLSASATAVIFGVTGGVEMLLFYPAGVGHGPVRPGVGRRALRGRCSGVGLLAPAAHHHRVARRSRPRPLVAVGNGLGSGIVMTLGADTAPPVGRSQFLGGWRFVSVRRRQRCAPAHQRRDRLVEPCGRLRAGSAALALARHGLARLLGAAVRPAAAVGTVTRR